MPPKRKLSCSCRKHSKLLWGQRTKQLSCSQNWQIQKKEVIGALNSNGALSDRAMYLCEGCAQYGGKNMTANKKRKLTGTKHDIVSTYKFYNYVIDLFKKIDIFNVSMNWYIIPYYNVIMLSIISCLCMLYCKFTVEELSSIAKCLG